jgi:hypothetical protein
MPLINPDTSEAGALQPGTYPAKILAADPGIAKSGAPKLVLKLDLEVNGKNKARQDHLPISGAGAFKFDNLLRAVGMHSIADAYRTPGGQKPDFDTDSLVGLELNVVVENEMYEGNPQDRIKAYLPR